MALAAVVILLAVTKHVTQPNKDTPAHITCLLIIGFILLATIKTTTTTAETKLLPPAIASGLQSIYLIIIPLMLHITAQASICNSPILFSLIHFLASFIYANAEYFILFTLKHQYDMITVY
jgi:hypothetical protein